jgi:hypothetical protein
MNIPMELLVEEQPQSCECFHVCWLGEPDSVLLANIPEAWLDLTPFMAARALLRQGYNPDRLLVVRLYGADFDLVRAPLGVVAAPPLLNFAKPVMHPLRCLYRDHRHV